MGVKSSRQVQNLEDVQSLLLGLGNHCFSPGMLKRRIFSPAENTRGLAHSRTCSTEKGKGLRCGKQSLKIFLLHPDGASEAWELGCAGKALGQVWRHFLVWQHTGCSPAVLMTEAITGCSSQALEGAQFLPDPPATQQHFSCYSFTL